MKRTVILLLAVLLALSTAQAQRKQRKSQPNKPQAKPVQSEGQKETELFPFSVLRNLEASLDCLQWSLASYGGSKKLRGGKDTLQDIDAYLNKPIPQSDEYAGGSRFYMKKYRDSFDKLFNDFDLSIKTGKVIGFTYDPEKGLPIQFARNDDGKLVFALTGVATNNVYNTLRLSVKQRAANILSSVSFPLAESIYIFLLSKQTGIDYLALSVSYGSRNFLDKDAHPDCEVIVFVAPTEALKQFVGKKITGDDLLEKSEVFAIDKDSFPSIRKIKVVLE